MAEVNKEMLRKLALEWISASDKVDATDDDEDFLEFNAVDEVWQVEASGDTVLALLDENAAQAARIAELERECERLRERLEINGQSPYDGIATRDITIEILEREIDRFKEANQRLSEEAVNRRNSAVEARRSASDLMAANMGLWAEAEDTKAERDTLRAELDACRKDAERWRYFRDRLGEPVDSDVFSAFNAWLWADASIEDVEAAIDAAMQEGGV